MSQVRTWMKQGSFGLMLLCAAGFAAAADEPDGEKPVVLKVGDQAPIFTGDNDEGKAWNSDDVVGKKYLVVYFYPADFTTGCTRQAEQWRDNMNALNDAGVAVIGVSGDSVRNHKLFKEAWKLNYTLLADEEAAIAKKFGVPVRGGSDRQPLTDEDGNPLQLERKATFARWTFIIGKEGQLLYKNMRVQPVKDSQQVLEFIQSLKTDGKMASTAGLPQE